MPEWVCVHCVQCRPTICRHGYESNWICVAKLFSKLRLGVNVSADSCLSHSKSRVICPGSTTLRSCGRLAWWGGWDDLKGPGTDRGFKGSLLFVVVVY